MKSSSTASSERSRGGEASALRYLGILLTGTVVALAAAEWMLRTVIVPIDDGRPNRVHLVYSGEQPDAVLGDSHLYRTFLTSDRFANLARAGSSPHALEIVAREYYRHRAPGRVIVQASTQLFNQLMQTRRAQGHDTYFAQNLGLPFRLYVFEPGISRELAAFWDLPALRVKASSSRRRMKHSGPAVEREAALRRALTLDERRSQVRQRVQSNRPVADVTASDGFAAYRRTLVWLAERGARICLVRTPVTDLYRETASLDSRHLETETAFRDLAQELGLRYVDFADLALGLDPVTSFTNPDHLTTAAGAHYAERVETACFE
jgi:hypothetical protein